MQHVYFRLRPCRVRKSVNQTGMSGGLKGGLGVRLNPPFEPPFETKIFDFHGECSEKSGNILESLVSRLIFFAMLNTKKLAKTINKLYLIHFQFTLLK